jgi:hypothetical protein
MIDDAWPLSQIQDDQLPPSRSTLVFAPLSQFRSGRNHFDADAFIMLTDQHECEIWNQIPLAAAVLGCGSPGVSTFSMSLPVNDFEWRTLHDVILGMVRSHIHSTEAQHRNQRSDLGPGTSPLLPKWLRDTILAAANKLPGEMAERSAVAAGLHLLYDDLNGSHSLSQTVEGRGKNHNGDYWHAILHRREPDYDNAKYWFRRVGSHPVFNELPDELERIHSSIPSKSLDQWANRLVTSDRWDPFAFVDACEAACERNADPEFRRALEEIQHFEMLHLLRQSCDDAGHR